MKLTVVILFIINTASCLEDSTVNDFSTSFIKTLGLLNNKVKTHPDAGLNISQYLEKYHYPLQTHDVTTEDGYILTLHRIPNGRNKIEASIASIAKPAVLLVHGLLCSGMDWIYVGPERSLALLLADLGYDVWLANARGSKPSMRHKTLNASNPAFYDYSWHEKGYYDLPAWIDYIIKTANIQNLTLIGHSQGTTDSMVLGSTRPEYNKKINLMVLLSPIAYMDGVSSPLVLLMVKYMDPLQVFFKLAHFYGMQYSPELTTIATYLCNEDSPFLLVCVNFIQLLCGYDFQQFNQSLFTVIVSNTPSGISVKELVHYGQEIKSGYFRQYDYGLGNIFRYGSSFPPSYNVTKITAPVAIYYSKNDFFASMEDVEKLAKQLPNVADKYLVELEKFNHFDFIMATDVKKLLYNRVLSVIQKHNPVN